jgi:hypothetical protein
MEFQHDKSWETFTTILNSRVTAREAWTKFIEFHEQNFPKTYWTRLKEIEIEEEQTNIVNWLTTVVTKKPIPKNIVAIWIGLLKLAGNDNSEIPTIYFGGADNYDKDDGDWACDLKYLPDNRYAQPGLLQEIDLVAKTDNDNYEFLDWILPLAYCAFIFDEVVGTKLCKDLFLKHKDKLFITVGHDSGDFIDLTPIAR